MHCEGVHTRQFQLSGNKSHRKWSMMLGPQNSTWYIKTSCIICIYGPPPSQTTPSKAAHPRPHDGHIVKKLTDGHRAVIGHDSEKGWCPPHQEVLSKELEHAAFQGDGSSQEEIYNHLAGNGRRVSSIQKGLKGNEKIH